MSGTPVSAAATWAFGGSADGRRLAPAAAPSVAAFGAALTAPRRRRRRTPARNLRRLSFRLGSFLRHLVSLAASLWATPRFALTAPRGQFGGIYQAGTARHACVIPGGMRRGAGPALAASGRAAARRRRNRPVNEFPPMMHLPPALPALGSGNERDSRSSAISRIAAAPDAEASAPRRATPCASSSMTDASIRHFLSLILHGAGIDTEELRRRPGAAAGADPAPRRHSSSSTSRSNSADAIECVVALGKHGLYRRRPAHEQPRLGRARARQEHRRAAPACTCCRCSRSRSRPARSSRSCRISSSAIRRRSPARIDLREALKQQLDRVLVSAQDRPAQKAARRRRGLFARARHPQYGVLMPGAFMPGASEGDLVTLSELALRTGAASRASISPSSASTCGSRSTSRSTRWSSCRSPTSCRSYRPQFEKWPGLIIDVTEEQIVTDLTLANDITKKLAHLNVKLAIDDFGRGYSSLARLKELPFAELKLDRTFVTDCGTDKVNAPLCKTVIDLAHNFGSVAVADRHREGVRRAGAGQHGLRLRPGLSARPADAGGALHFAAQAARQSAGANGCRQSAGRADAARLSTRRRCACAGGPPSEPAAVACTSNFLRNPIE